MLIFANTANDFLKRRRSANCYQGQAISTVITGFNTDIEYNGVVYHVQTEDKGLDTPLLLSLVYTKGEILAAKRTPYEDLIAVGFDEKVLAERLQKQHRLICAAIKQGRVEDLKRMSAAKEAATVAKPQAEEIDEFPDAPMPQILDLAALDLEPLMDLPLALIDIEGNTAEPLPEPPIDFPPENARILRPSVELPKPDFLRAEAAPAASALNLTLLDDKEFHGGDNVEMRVQVTQGTEERGIVGADVMIKVLGAAFRPVILNAKTDENGVAAMQLQFPQFKSGRAALLVKATFNGSEAELRRIVMQG